MGLHYWHTTGKHSFLFLQDQKRDSGYTVVLHGAKLCTLKILNPFYLLYCCILPFHWYCLKRRNDDMAYIVGDVPFFYRDFMGQTSWGMAFFLKSPSSAQNAILLVSHVITSFLLYYNKTKMWCWWFQLVIVMILLAGGKRNNQVTLIICQSTVFVKVYFFSFSCYCDDLDVK